MHQETRPFTSAGEIKKLYNTHLGFDGRVKQTHLALGSEIKKELVLYLFKGFTRLSKLRKTTDVVKATPQPTHS
jgi:hypothetical protein